MAKNNLEIVKNLELIATGDSVAQNEFGASKSFTVKGVSSKRSKIVQMTLISSEGDVLTNPLGLHFFRTNPAILAGDTEITPAQGEGYIGVQSVIDTDWEKNGVTQTAVMTLDTKFYFDANDARAVYISVQNLGTSTFSGEQLEITLYYKGVL